MGLKDAGLALPPSVGTKEPICSSSSGALGPNIRMRRVTGGMNLRSGGSGSRKYKTLTAKIWTIKRIRQFLPSLMRLMSAVGSCLLSCP